MPEKKSNKVKLICASCASEVWRYPSHAQWSIIFCNWDCKRAYYRLPDYFWRSVVKTDSCWLWVGPTHGPDGRGSVGGGKTQDYAYRYSWKLHHGPIPEGMQACHKCDNPSCVNPGHLFLGTNSDNVQDSLKKGRFPVGERAASAKITAQDVLAIRAAQRNNSKSIAAKYGLTARHIRKIQAGQTWRHLNSISPIETPRTELCSPALAVCLVQPDLPL